MLHHDTGFTINGMDEINKRINIMGCVLDFKRREESSETGP